MPRVQALAGTLLPDGLALPGTQGADLPVVSPASVATVLFTCPGTGKEWDEQIPGAVGCSCGATSQVGQCCATADTIGAL
jgi:hypothetical protein